MPSWVVEDPGIFLATFLNKSQSQQADTIINYWKDEDIQVAVPTLFRYEIITVLRKNVYRGLISAPEALIAQNSLLPAMLRLDVLIDDALFKHRYKCATQLNRPTA